jgi:prefoldin beta subunit
MDKTTQEKIGKLQLMEQQLQQFALQKQQFQTQLFEIESAITESAQTTKAYKIVGNIMIAADKEELKKELTQKKDIASLRIKTIEKQENKIKDEAKSIQEEVMGQMKNPDKK